MCILWRQGSAVVAAVFLYLRPHTYQRKGQDRCLYFCVMLGATPVTTGVSKQSSMPCALQVIGSISGSGRITLVDKEAPPGTPTPVDLDLDKVSLTRNSL
jgi:hypothetical protein